MWCMSLVIHYLSCNGVFYLSHVGRGGGTLCKNKDQKGFCHKVTFPIGKFITAVQSYATRRVRVNFVCFMRGGGGARKHGTPN